MPITNQHLCLADRQVIKALSQAGKTQAQIAIAIDCSQSTVSRELRRNRGTHGYFPKQADEKAQERKYGKKPRRKVVVGKVKERVIECFAMRMSPQMISMALTRENKPVSTKTIYQFVREDRYDGGDLYKLLRINGKKRNRRLNKASRNKISNRVPITDRPTVVDLRKRYGDWEADLIEGAGRGGYLLSLYERKSRLGLICKLQTKTAKETSAAIIRQLRGLKVRTITYDNGLEFAHHKQVSDALGGFAYFCSPYHSWEKGGVENYNRNVRVFYPKGTDFSVLSAPEVKLTQDLINQWPKKILKSRSPVELQHWLKQ